MNTDIDFDLHGIVRIRLVDATLRDADAVRRQLGPIEAPFEGEPDIVIRFVDELSSSPRMRYLDFGDVAFTDDAFYILRGKHKSRTKVKIPFQDIGKQCEIVCEHGLTAVPHLIDIINTTALGNGFLPIHASAFNYGDVGILVTGWAKGGKTETLLAFMTNGAEYVGDEWVYLSPDGERMAGIPVPIRVWDWHLDDLPVYRKMLDRRDRRRLRILRALVRATEKGFNISKSRKGFLSKLMIRITPLLKRQMFVNWRPEKLFETSAVSMKGSPDKVFFVGSHVSSDVIVTPMDPLDVAKRVYFSMQGERDDFVAIYQRYRFAFPDQPNELIENAEQLQHEYLMQALSGKEAYSVFHPYPAPIPELFEAISPLCKNATA